MDDRETIFHVVLGCRCGAAMCVHAVLGEDQFEELSDANEEVAIGFGLTTIVICDECEMRYPISIGRADPVLLDLATTETVEDIP